VKKELVSQLKPITYPLTIIIKTDHPACMQSNMELEQSWNCDLLITWWDDKDLDHSSCKQL